MKEVPIMQNVLPGSITIVVRVLLPSIRPSKHARMVSKNLNPLSVSQILHHELSVPSQHVPYYSQRDDYQSQYFLVIQIVFKQRSILSREIQFLRQLQ